MHRVHGLLLALFVTASANAETEAEKETRKREFANAREETLYLNGEEVHVRIGQPPEFQQVGVGRASGEDKEGQSADD